MVVDGSWWFLCLSETGPPSSEHLCWWRSTCSPLPSCIYLCIPVFIMTKLRWKLSSPALWALLWSSAQVCLLPFPALQLLHSLPQLAPFPLCPRLVLRWTCLRVHFHVLDRQSAARHKDPRGTRRSGEGIFSPRAEISLWSLSWYVSACVYQAIV